MNISNKEDAVLLLLNQLDSRHEKVIRIYFGLGNEKKKSIEDIGNDFELNVGEVIELKNNAIREFIRLILSTGMFGDKGGNFTDEFIQASQSEFLDNFMRKFIGVN